MARSFSEYSKQYTDLTISTDARAKNFQYFPT